MTQFAKSLGFDLADALACDGEVLADFFERMFASVLQPETHLDDFLFARTQGLQDLRGLLAQVEIDDSFGR